MNYSIQTPDQSRAEASPHATWLWEGYLASGMITLLTSRWKMGKTTLLSFLLAQLKNGGELAGRSIARGRVLIVSEEPSSLWLARHDRHDFGSEIRWCCRPFAARPTSEEWRSLIDTVAEHSADVVVFDPLAMVLPSHVENNSSLMLMALEPLRRLTSRGAAVLVLHHPSKNSSPTLLRPRGSGALAGFADILLELDRPPGASRTDRRRSLRSDSRLCESTAVMLELSADGKEYRVLAEPVEPDNFDCGWSVLKAIFEDASERLTRKGILSNWPEDQDKPHAVTVYRWLERALVEKRIERKGKGRCQDPFRFCLPGFIPYIEDMEPLPPLGRYR